MLELLTTGAQVCVHAEAPVGTWFHYDARVVVDTLFQLATGEHLRYLRCRLRLLPWTAPCASTLYRDTGCVAFVDRCDDAMRPLPSECLIGLAVGPEAVAMLAAVAKAGDLSSRVELDLMACARDRDE